ncbi:GntR family transcriptional regulator [Bordetella ansorpii]|uniref:GntR family transcriptional regulator n=1 Tax=Bordetella ansorpii TaxID=288768 RepID=A0A157S9Y2_9BORD|nr:FadR/GntR family transcriptional regulator [Bordetella ansorpii]SAI67232.1 GntR family transcriptional regulator [Bordetella ansorpii]
MKTSSADRLLSDQAYEALLALLGTDEFAAGMRLPAENALAERFGVSRPVLRQALARLRAEGRIQSRKGSGHFVDQPRPQASMVSFGQLTSIPDVRSFLEFRCSVEGEIAARAAQHHTDEDMALIVERRQDFERALLAGASGVDEDIAFHLAIAQASGNRFFSMTMQALVAQTRFSIELVRSLADRSRAQRHDEVCREHAAIVDGIASRDARVARDAMLAHLHGGISRLFGAPPPAA